MRPWLLEAGGMLQRRALRLTLGAVAVIVMRRAKRLASNVRANFSTADGRKANRADYAKFLLDHPIDVGCIRRIIDHIKECFPEQEPGENLVLQRGYF
jgi:hypothetical protein